MKLCLRIGVLLFVITGALSQDGFDLFDALDPVPTPPKAKDPPKIDDIGPPAKPPSSAGDDGFDLEEAFGPDPPSPPKNPNPPSTGGGDGFNLEDAFGPDPPSPPKNPNPPSTGRDGGFDLEDAFGADPPSPPNKPNQPSTGGGDGFDLEDALGGGSDSKPNNPAGKPNTGGGGGSFDDSDLFNLGGGDYKPDGGRSGGGSFNNDGGQGGYDPRGGADQPQEAGSGQIAGIVSAVGVALVGAASSYIAYQKKKLCFKLQGGADPESGKGHHGSHSEPQVLSNLLRTN